MNTSVDALLLLTSSCPHCPVIMQGLTQLLKEGKLRRVEFINIEQDAEAARIRNVRSVPWFQIGELTFSGLYSPAELEEWVQAARAPDGLQAYVLHKLEHGELKELERSVETHPTWLKRLLPLIANMDISINLRIGLGALIESQSGSEALKSLIPELEELSQHHDARIRGDACHYLGLTGSDKAIPVLKKYLNDLDEHVKEIARDSIKAIQADL